MPLYIEMVRLLDKKKSFFLIISLLLMSTEITSDLHNVHGPNEPISFAKRYLWYKFRAHTVGRSQESNEARYQT